MCSLNIHALRFKTIYENLLFNQLSAANHLLKTLFLDQLKQQAPWEPYNDHFVVNINSEQHPTFDYLSNYDLDLLKECIHFCFYLFFVVKTYKFDPHCASHNIYLFNKSHQTKYNVLRLKNGIWFIMTQTQRSRVYYTLVLRLISLRHLNFYACLGLPKIDELLWNLYLLYVELWGL